MPKVRLDGAPPFLDALAVLFSDDPRIVVENGFHYLEARAIDDAIDAEQHSADVSAMARSLVGQMNVVGRAQIGKVFRPVTVTDDWVGYKPNPYVRITSVIGVSGDASFVPDIEVAGLVLKAADVRPEVARALRFLDGTNGYPDWHDLGKVRDIIKDSIGLSRLNTWVDADTTGRFRESMNNPELSGERARHGVARDTAIEPMHLADAITLWVGVVIRWICELEQLGSA